MSRTVKIFFPVGIFLVLYMLFFSLSTGISGFYYYKYTLNFIDKVTKDANESSIALIEACSIIAELSDGKELKDRLNQFFSSNPQKKLFLKAFYALGNGNIIIHSHPEEIKQLNGNLATDEFKYNIDQIFYPLSRNEKKVFLLDYYILDEEIPFTKDEIKYLKQYIYKNIDRNGWLATKAVKKRVKTGKKKYEIRKTGTINFILSKKPIYDEILKVKQRVIQTIMLSATAGCLLSIFLSFIIFIRYNSIRKKTLKTSLPAHTSVNTEIAKNLKIKTDDNLFEDDDIDIITDDMYPEIFDENTGEKVEIDPADFLKSSKYSEINIDSGLSSEKSYKKPVPPIQIVYDESSIKSESDIVILDAVPIKKRRIS